jgi:hypothetical protein
MINLGLQKSCWVPFFGLDILRQKFENIEVYNYVSTAVDKNGKMIWNRLWNPIQRVDKGVATTYFHVKYPGRWSMESQRTLEWPKQTSGNKYTQHWYSYNDCCPR